MKPADKALSEKLRTLREAYELEQRTLLDEHMAEHYADTSVLWAHARRASIEVASWPAWKRRRCYSQD